MDVNLSKLIIRKYYGVFEDVLAHGHTHYTLYGGRGSTKSSFVGVMVPLLVVMNPNVHAVCFRKVANTIRDSVYAQCQYGISLLGIDEYFHFSKSPFEITYVPTRQRIMFRGLDDPGKIKSLKAPFGYFGVTHFEELDQYAGREEVRNVLQSTMRGGAAFWNFETFNPPISASNWANQDILESRPDRLVVKSSYLDVHTEWLSEQFIEEAEHVKRLNPRAYEHEYTGVPTGTGGNVFENVADERLKPSTFDNPLYGVDFGDSPSPWAFVACQYEPDARTLYIFDEAKLYKSSSHTQYETLVAHSVEDGLIICDSAQKYTIRDYQEFGLNAVGAEKAHRDYSFKWLQALDKIVIDKERCPDTYKEFVTYEYERTRANEIISGFPKKNDHFIDAARYAANLLWRSRGM